MKNEDRTGSWSLGSLQKAFYAFAFLLVPIHLTALDSSSQDKSTPPERNLYFQGKHVYDTSCMPCHGKRGKGDGELVSQDWEVFPRDLSKAEFKYRSTAYGKLPTNEDLKRTVRHGIAGSAMPTFHDMNQKDVSAVIEYIKYFSRNWKKEENHGVALDLPIKPEKSLSPTEKRAYLHEGNRLFQQLCAPCHGIQGKGDGPVSKSLEDSDGNPLPPANLRMPLGCGDLEEDILRTILTGMSGTPMPSFAEALSPKEVWQIVSLLSEWRNGPVE